MDDMAAFGVDKHDARQWAAQGASDDGAPGVFEVWEENWPTVEAFLALETQWRVISSLAGTRLQGLDNSAVLATLSMLDVAPADRRQMFQDLRLMEGAALETLYPPKA